MVDALVSGASVERRASSTLVPGTKKPPNLWRLLLFCVSEPKDTAKPSDGSYTYKEVATSANDYNQFDFIAPSKHQGICQLGWHLPTDAEWNTMEAEVSGSDWQSSYATLNEVYRGLHAGKLSTGCFWNSSNNANAPGNYSNAERNASGFSAVPAGEFRDNVGGNNDFQNDEEVTVFWSSRQYNSQYTFIRELSSEKAGMRRDNYPKEKGYSVRCVRNN